TLTTYRLRTRPVQPVGLRGHDEVVAVEATNLVCPPAHGHASPLRQQRGMVPFLLGDRADSIRELERLREVVEFEYTAQPLHAVDLDELPVRTLRLQLGDLFISHRRRATSAGDALLRGERHAGGAVDSRSASRGRNEKSGSGFPGASIRLFNA